MASMSMDRTNASYKIRFGLAKSFEEDMCEELRTTIFSLNIDEATSRNLEKVLAVLVSSYSVTSGKVVIRHLTSTSMTRVNSQALYNCLMQLFTKLNLPWTNVVSILMDSCSVMRGFNQTRDFDTPKSCPSVARHWWRHMSSCPQCQQEVLCSIWDNWFLVAITTQWL